MPVVVIFLPGTCAAQPKLLARFVIVCTPGVVGAGIMAPPGPDMTVRLLRPAPPQLTLPTSGMLTRTPRFVVSFPVKMYCLGAAPTAVATSRAANPNERDAEYRNARISSSSFGRAAAERLVKWIPS